MINHRAAKGNVSGKSTPVQMQERLHIETDIPEGLRKLARQISSCEVSGDPHPNFLTVIELDRARAAGKYDPSAINALSHVFKERFGDLREEKTAKLFGPPRLDEQGEIYRKTRIVCTIGPKCNSPEIMAEMIKAGMDVARLNFSHINSLEEAKVLVENLHAAMKIAGRRVTVFGDLPGPKIRVTGIEAPVEARKGTILEFGDREGAIHLNPPCIAGDLKVGHRLLIDDGKLRLEVTSKEPDGTIKAKVLVGGLIKPRKGINLPDTIISEKVPTERDIEKMTWIKALGITRVAGSFIETAGDVQNIRNAWNAIQVAYIFPPDGEELQVISKVERPLAVTNAEEIFAASDGIMIARGDAAVELGGASVPIVQQNLHNLGFRKDTPCGTATQMLSSLQTGNEPLRAELNDVASSVMQRASFVMTSEETAMADDPVNTVRHMDDIVAKTEKALKDGIAHYINQP